MICPGLAIIPPLNPKAIDRQLPNGPMRWIAAFGATAKSNGAAAIEFGEVLEAVRRTLTAANPEGTLGCLSAVLGVLQSMVRGRSRTRGEVNSWVFQPIDSRCR
jgi:hypothetical protein